MITLLAALPNIHALLIGFLIIIIVLAIIVGLVWFIERYVHALPDMFKVVLAIVLVILVILWALEGFSGISL